MSVSLSSKRKDEILQQKMAFIYSRTVPENQVIADPDKVSLVRTQRAPVQLPASEMVDSFTGEHACLHPAFPTTVCLVVGAEERALERFPSFEHALQASKLLSQQDRAHLCTLAETREVKRFVNKRTKEDPTCVVPQSEWNERCLEIALSLLRDKFMRSKEAKTALMKTGHKKLIFVNDYKDLFWGASSARLDARAQLDGKNHLGALLERVRKEIDYGDDIELWIAQSLRAPLAHPERVRLKVRREYLVGNEDADRERAKDREIERVAREEAAAKRAEERQRAREKEKGKDYKKTEEEKQKEREEEREKEREREGDLSTQSLADKHIFFLGKGDFNDIRCSHPSISKAHAALAVDREGRVFAIDLHSTHGTRVNNATIAPFEFHELPRDQENIISLAQSSGRLCLTVRYLSPEERDNELLQRVLQESQEGSQTGDSKYGPGASGGDGNSLTVFVGNVPPEASEESLRKFFSVCGEIVSLSVPVDRRTGQHKGIAFVSFASVPAVLQAVGRDGDAHYGVALRVKKSAAGSSKGPAHQGQGHGHGQGGGHTSKDNRGTSSGTAPSRFSSEPMKSTEFPPTKLTERDITEAVAVVREQYGHGIKSEPEQSRKSERERTREKSRSPARREDRRPRDDSRARDRSRGKERERERDRDRDRDRDRGGHRDRDSRRRSPSRSVSRSPRRRSDREKEKRTNDYRERERERGRDSRARASKRARSPSASPPRSSAKRSSRFAYAPQRSPSHSLSPPRRPAGRNANASPSPSPPRRPAGRNTNASPSPSPPRRPTGRNANASPSPSPPRRPAGRNANASPSPSPPRRPTGRNANASPSPSPPRKSVPQSTSPQRRQEAHSAHPQASPSPPRRPAAIRTSSPSY